MVELSGRAPSAGTAGAIVSTVNLTQAAADVRLTLGQQTVTEHERDLALREQARLDAAVELRGWLAERVVPKFLWANGLTLLALAVLALLDEVNLILHFTSDRIITERVILTLLGATTVQVGAIALAIALSLFPSRSS